mgnify:CR=1 FL=1
MNLVLGTAQFDEKYGINRIKKKLSFKSKKKIISFLKKNKINTIDTASNYKNAEYDLGKIGIKKFNIITKIPKLKKKFEIKEQLFSYIFNSLTKLRIKKIHALLIHDIRDLDKKNKFEYLNFLKYLKKKKIVKKIGISIYNFKDLNKIIKFWTPDIVQLPYNIFDRRIENKPFLNMVKKYRIEIHARSIYLQGLLVQKSKNKKFKKWEKLFNEWFLWCKQNHIKPFEAAYLFVKKNSNIKKIIIGVDDIAQLNKITKIKRKIDKFPKFNCKDRKLLNPYNWNNL